VKIIDVHVHAFRNPELGRGYQMGMGTPEPERDGDLPELLRIMETAGIEQSVLLMYMPSLPMYRRELTKSAEEEAKATVIGRIQRNNAWGLEVVKQDPDKFRVMVGVDPNLMTPEQIRAEIANGVENGASGGKIVLQSQEIRADDPRMWPLYEICQELDVPIMMQSGGNRAWGDDPYGRPKYFDKAFAAFPNVRLILAHLGVGFEDETVELASKYPNCFTDLAGRLSPHGFADALSLQQLADLIHKIGVDRVMFGTNYPGSDPVEFVEKLEQLPLSNEEKEAIAAGNTVNVFRR
jgi:predicted TIM-barrel fold metal-dependent hydrolase